LGWCAGIDRIAITGSATAGSASAAWLNRAVGWDGIVDFKLQHNGQPKWATVLGRRRDRESINGSSLEFNALSP
jgi:hypothetical protein